MTTTKILFSGKHLFVNANAGGGNSRLRSLTSGVTLRGFAADRCIPIRADGTRQMAVAELTRLVSANWQTGAHPVLPRSRTALFVLVSPSVSGESLGYVAAGGPGLNGSQDSTTDAGSSASESAYAGKLPSGLLC